jgi:hypothetical protein
MDIKPIKNIIIIQRRRERRSLSSITIRRIEEAGGSICSERFLKSAIVQGSIVTGLAIIFGLGM